MKKLRLLVKGKVFFAGDNFSILYKFQSEINKGQFGKVLLLIEVRSPNT
jgi:hypothetical protein